MKHKLFMPLPAGQRRDKSFILRVNRDEFIQIKNAAGIRHMTVSEYLRRVALGRKADVTFEANITVMLGRLVCVVRDMYAATKDKGTNFPESDWRRIINEADKAIQLIGNL